MRHTGPLLIAATLAAVGCSALSPAQGAGAQQGGVNVGPIMPNAHNLSPDTRVQAGRDIDAKIEAAVLKAVATVTAGRDANMEARFSLLDQAVRAQTAQVTSYGISTAGVLAFTVAAFCLGILASLLVAVVAKWRKSLGVDHTRRHLSG